jgi:hypothetical protein
MDVSSVLKSGECARVRRNRTYATGCFSSVLRVGGCDTTAMAAFRLPRLSRPFHVSKMRRTMLMYPVL